jgi:hypothetical protein
VKVKSSAVPLLLPPLHAAVLWLLLLLLLLLALTSYLGSSGKPAKDNTAR